MVSNMSAFYIAIQY